METEKLEKLEEKIILFLHSYMLKNNFFSIEELKKEIGCDKLAIKLLTILNQKGYTYIDTDEKGTDMYSKGLLTDKGIKLAKYLLKPVWQRKLIDLFNLKINPAVIAAIASIISTFIGVLNYLKG